MQENLLPKEVAFYMGLYQLVKKDGKYLVKQIGEVIPEKNGLPDIESLDVRNMQIGQAFMKSVTDYANKNGLKMTEQAEERPPQTKDDPNSQIFPEIEVLP